MEELPKGFLKIRGDALTAIRRQINLGGPGEMREAVRILGEWVKQQEHFRTKDFPPRYLEATIVACKGSIERAKLSLDKLCTMRTLVPDKFPPFDLKRAYQMLKENEFHLLLPQQTEDHKRVHLTKTTTFDESIINMLYKATYAMMDYTRIQDYNCGFNVLIDFTDADIMEATKNVNLNDFKTAYQITTECFKTRVNRVDIVTSSKLIETFLNIIKPFLKKKIADRIKVHKTYESLHEYYPREILPKEYGGDEKTLRELQDEFMEELSTAAHVEFMRRMYETRTDEARRSQYEFNDLYAGTVGTFRALTVD